MRTHPQRQVSSGGVIVRQRGGALQVCLIVRRQHGARVWGLPKGHVERGETRQAAALREVLEETGLHGEPVAPLGSIAYAFTEGGVRYAKRVHFVLMRYRAGQTRHHDDEVEDAVWVSLDDALKRLSYPSERAVLLKAQRYLNKHIAAHR